MLGNINSELYGSAACQNAQWSPGTASLGPSTSVLARFLASRVTKGIERVINIPVLQQKQADQVEHPCERFGHGASGANWRGYPVCTGLP